VRKARRPAKAFYDRFMKQLMKTLVELQTLEFGQKPTKTTAAPIAKLRSKIPDNVLGHYDRLMARGKKGVAAVRNQNCAGCHMSVPLAVVMTLKHADDIQLCDNCGRYLYLPDEEEAPQPPAKVKPKKAASKQITDNLS
jgi:hypothetical protein